MYLCWEEEDSFKSGALHQLFSVDVLLTLFISSPQIETERITIASETTPAPSPTSSPLYCMSLTYSRSSNGGKTLIKGTELAKQERPYTSLFDSEGNFDELRFVTWLTELSSRLVEDGSE